MLPSLSPSALSRTDPRITVDMRYVRELCEELLCHVLAGKPVLALSGDSPERLRGVIDQLQPLLSGSFVRVVRIGSPDGAVIDIRALCRLVLATEPAARTREPAERFFHILTKATHAARQVLLIIEDAELLAPDSFANLEQIMAAVAIGSRPLQVLLVGSALLWERLPPAGAFAAACVKAPVREAASTPAARPLLREAARNALTLDRVAALVAADMAGAPAAPGDRRAQRLASAAALLAVAGMCGVLVVRFPLLGERLLREPSRAFRPAAAASAPIAAPQAPAAVPSPVTPSVEVAVKPVPAPPREAAAAPVPVSAAVLAGLLARAGSLMDLGDVATARLVYQRAAELGSAHAATAAGMTYDARFLAGFGARGIVADQAAAAAWYRRGAALGDPQAASLLAAPGNTASR